MSGGPRLAPVPRSELTAAQRQVIETAFPAAAERMLGGGEGAMAIPNVVGTLVHNPALAGPYLVYNQVLLTQSTLGHRLRELVILRVAWTTRSTYEWLQHVRLARHYGVTDDEIDAITRGAGDAAWSGLERDALAATEQLLAGYDVDDATWTRLAGGLDAAQLVELTFVVGTYAGLAMAFNAFGLQPEPELEALDVPRPA